MNEYKLWGFSELVRFDQLKYDQVVKMVVFSQGGVLSELQRKLLDSVGDTANIYLTGKNDFKSIDIVDKSTSKMLAIKRILEIYKLKNDEAAVFGDDFNDIEMLREFVHSIAMGNVCGRYTRYLEHQKDVRPHAELLLLY
jgi:hydroxymethylpyrimidine pyrophosphatase-like HAD family hydrolase